MIRPADGRSTPPSRLSSVVFPQPLGPMIATASPVRTSHVFSRSAWTSSAAVWYRLLTPDTVTVTPLFLNIPIPNPEPLRTITPSRQRATNSRCLASICPRSPHPDSLRSLHRSVRGITIDPPAEPRRNAHQQAHHDQRHPRCQRRQDQPRRQQLHDRPNLPQRPYVIGEPEAGERCRSRAE